MISEISTRIDEFEQALRSMDSGIRKREMAEASSRHIVIEAADFSTGLRAFDSLPAAQNTRALHRLRVISEELAKRQLTVEIWANKHRCATLGIGASSVLPRLLGLRHVEVTSWKCFRTLWSAN